MLQNLIQNESLKHNFILAKPLQILLTNFKIKGYAKLIILIKKIRK